MHIIELCCNAHEIAKEKGFWKKKREVGTLLMLIVSELGEALEADRKGRKSPFIQDHMMHPESDKDRKWFEKEIKDTFEDEIADTFIRLGDLCKGFGIDIEKHIILKMRYNKTRPHKHGKSY